MRAGHQFSPWPACVLAGFFLVAAFAPFDWAWCGWVAYAPGWIALRGSAAVRSHPFRHGYLVGLVFMLGCFWWVGSVTLAGLAVMCLGVAVFQALWFLLLARVAAVPGDRRALSFRELAGHALLAAAFWVTLERLRSWSVKGFIWNDLGVSQVPSAHLRQLAALGGVPLLTFVLVVGSVFIGEALWSAWRRWWHAAGRAALAAAVILAAGWGYGAERLARAEGETPRASISYACIQPEIPEIPYASGDRERISQAEVDAMNAQQDLSARAIASAPQLLVWPEAVTMQRIEGGRLLGQVIDHLEAYYHGSFLLGSEEYVDGKFYNSAFLLGPDRSSLQRYRKVYLVILGEYLPWGDALPWLNRWLGRTLFATPGTEPGHFLLAREGLSLAPLMCFEDTQPEVVDAAAALQPDFFVTMINAGWFEAAASGWCLPQHLENSILRCVEHDRPMIRCADTGITCEIDAQGNIVAQLPFPPDASPTGGGILSRTLILYPWAPTLYERWGDWVGWLSRLAALGAGTAYFFRGKSLSLMRIKKKGATV